MLHAISRNALEHFPTKWIPVRRRKFYKIKNLEKNSASVGSEFALAALAATVWAAPALAAGANMDQHLAKPECFDALRQSGGTRLSCEHHAWMTDDERADVVKLTRGYLQDARCTVTVDIERRLVDEALAASDRVFEAPPQPVLCELQTSGGPMKIGGTFSPRVVFKDGFAIDATPGLANITGVNSYLAWPVVAYINGAKNIKSEMAAMINAIRTRLTNRQQAAK